MAYVTCPSCHKELRNNAVAISDNFISYRCPHCTYCWAVKIKDKNMNYIIIRDDNDNRKYTSIEQAITVAEKLAKENPDHSYYVAKLIKESKINNVITVDLE